MAAWLLILLCFGIDARAHQPVGYDLRFIHFQRSEARLHAFFRMTLPLVVGKQLGAANADGTYQPAPFTINRIESQHLFHYADIGRIRADPRGLAKLVMQGHTISVNGKELSGELVGASVYPKGHVPPFDTIDDARAATADAAFPDGVTEIDAAYVLVDVHVLYACEPPIGRISVQSDLAAGSLGQPQLQNVFVDHPDGEEAPVIYTQSGAIVEPFTIGPDS